MYEFVQMSVTVYMQSMFSPILDTGRRGRLHDSRCREVQEKGLACVSMTLERDPTCSLLVYVKLNGGVPEKVTPKTAGSSPHFISNKTARPPLTHPLVDYPIPLGSSPMAADALFSPDPLFPAYTTRLQHSSIPLWSKHT